MASIALKEYCPKDRAAWRSWLQKNHATQPGVWLIYYKLSSGKRKLSYEAAVDEALCFGWIDSLPRKLDDERSMLKFSPRKPKSVWSQLNKTRVEKLIQQKLMTEAGLKKIEEAKTNGSWDALTSSDKYANNNSMPADLQKILKTNKTALRNFQAFAPSYRKQFLSWIENAKTAATRSARMQQTLLMSAANKKPGPKGFKL